MNRKELSMTMPQEMVWILRNHT